MGDSKKTIPCGGCRRRFAQEEDLQKHMISKGHEVSTPQSKVSTGKGSKRPRVETPTPQKVALNPPVDQQSTTITTAIRESAVDTMNSRIGMPIAESDLFFESRKRFKSIGDQYSIQVPSWEIASSNDDQYPGQYSTWVRTGLNGQQQFVQTPNWGATSFIPSTPLGPLCVNRSPTIAQGVEYDFTGRRSSYPLHPMQMPSYAPSRPVPYNQVQQHWQPSNEMRQSAPSFVDPFASLNRFADSYVPSKFRTSVNSSTHEQKFDQMQPIAYLEQPYVMEPTVPTFQGTYHPQTASNSLPVIELPFTPNTISSPESNHSQQPIWPGNSPVLKPQLQDPRSESMVVRTERDSTQGTVSCANPAVWTLLDPTEYQNTWKALRSKPHQNSVLLKAHYRLAPYTSGEITEYMQCKTCDQRVTSKRVLHSKECTYHPQKTKMMNDKMEKVYVCCGKNDKGCKTVPEHVFQEVSERTRDFLSSFAQTPSHFGPDKRDAVVLDCEMVGVTGRCSEAVRLCASDFITGTVLVDTFIRPDHPVVDWRTKYSGVTEAIMMEAYQQGRVVDSWRVARDMLWNFVNEDTILIGQNLWNDLNVLRIVHTRIIDSGLLASAAMGPEPRRTWGLKNLCSELLNIEIQNKGKQGHDCMEDCMATREVVLWMIRHPEEFKQWGEVKAAEEKKKREEEAAKREEERIKKAEEEKKKKEAENGKGPLTDKANEAERERLIDLGILPYV